MIPWLHIFFGDALCCWKLSNSAFRWSSLYYVPHLEKASLNNYEKKSHILQQLVEVECRTADHGKLKHSLYKFLIYEIYNGKGNWPSSLTLEICCAKKHVIFILYLFCLTRQHENVTFANATCVDLSWYCPTTLGYISLVLNFTSLN